VTFETQDLARRLEKLERENRRLKRGGLVVAGLLGLVGLTGMVAPRLCNTVWAERFVLNDNGGKTRLTLDAYRSGDPVVTAQDQSGKTIAKLTLSGSPTLEFYDAEGTCTGKIGVSKGEPYVEKAKDDSVAMR
jgi:hypothetical protein